MRAHLGATVGRAQDQRTRRVMLIMAYKTAIRKRSCASNCFAKGSTTSVCRHWQEKFTLAEDRQEADGNVSRALNACGIERDESGCN